jgi:DDE superfamily endonuclease
VKALACELPHRCGVPLSRWSRTALRRAVLAQGLVAEISGTTIWRWLSRDTIRPWRYRSWIFPRDPAFAAKAGPILDLYAGRWQGRLLGPREYVLCADEKTSIQARRRRHPSQPPAAGRPMRIEHEYTRGGAWAYLAAWDVHRAQVFGRCERTTGIVPFRRLVAQVMRQEPYRSATRVFWIVDNGSSHRGDRAQRRLQTEWPRLVLVHTPVHASWLNQIEIYFSILPGSCGEAARGAGEPRQEDGQVAPGECPLERGGRLRVVRLKPEKAILDRGEAGEVVGREDLALMKYVTEIACQST